MKNPIQILQENEEEILRAIDSDPDLIRKDHPSLPLRIANASVNLTKPVGHQIFAKGIVYNPTTFELVSMPFVKFFNDFELVDDEYTEWVVNHPNIRMVFAEKYDGSLIQLFKYKSRPIVTTRGSWSNEYIAAAVKILKKKYRETIAKLDDDKTLLFELIHPVSRQVVDYGDEEDLVLLGVFDKGFMQYFRHVEHPFHHRRVAEYREFSDINEGIRWSHERGEEFVNEGHVIHFELGNQIIHRMKIKNDRYINLFRIKSRCHIRHVFDAIWEQGIFDWETFKSQFPEELEKDFEKVFQEAMDLIHECEEITLMLEEKVGQVPEGMNRREVYESLAGDPLQSAFMRCYSGQDPFPEVLNIKATFKGARYALKKNKGVYDEYVKRRAR